VEPISVDLTINGTRTSIEVEPRTLLLHALRDRGLTGAKPGCDTSQCGTCTVLVDGRGMKSCTVLAVQADGREVTTIEGISNSRRLHPVQEAFRTHHGLQCGYCTPGMIMLALDLLGRDSDPSEEAIRKALAGNICRCTGYHTIVESIRAAASSVPGAT
jgi:carbon-monoxide dehydrogenase small subunit